MATLWRITFLIAVLLSTLRAHSTPLHEFGVKLYLRMQVDSRQNASLLLYSPFGDYSEIKLALYGENRWSVHFAQKLQNFDQQIDPDPISQSFVRYAGKGVQFEIGKIWMPFGQGLGERELVRGAHWMLPVARGNRLNMAIADNGRGRQSGVFCRVGSNTAGISVAIGQNLAQSRTAFAFIRGDRYQPRLGAGYRVLWGVDLRQVAGITLWQVEAIAGRGGDLPDTEWLLVQASTRLPGGLMPTLRAEVDVRRSDLRWMLSVQQQVGGGFALYPQAVFRQANLEQVNIELRASF